MPAGVVPARIQEVKLTEAIIEMVKANLGISALARWAVQPFLEIRRARGAAAHRARPASTLERGDAEGSGEDRLHPRVHRSPREERPR